MPVFLLRAGSALLLWFLLGLLPAAASHLVGGELTYRYLDSKGPATAPCRYEITARIYFNKEAGSSAPNGSPNIRLSILSKAPAGFFLLQNTIPLSVFREITPPTLPGCNLRFPRVTLGQYITQINLPIVSEGYLATFTASARNEGITNLISSQNESMNLSVDMTPASIPNSSPAFSDNALAAICLGDTSYVLNNAYDTDGDRLSYSLATPNSTSINQQVYYAQGYSGTQPFGPSGNASVDARTGLARYLSFVQGTFLVGIDVKEYRTINGREVLLGTLRRDIQIVVRACGTVLNLPPAFTTATTAQKDFILEEGQTVSFNITATDPENQTLNMTVSSVLLDGSGPIDASLNGQPGALGAGNPVGSIGIAGNGSVTGRFRLRAGCSLARPEPYDVVVSVADAVCGSKTIATVFRIRVVRQAPPTRVRGDSVLCAQRVATYTALGPTFGEYRWTVRGGRVLGPATGRAVQVEWLSAGANRVTVRGFTAEGCPTDSATHAVAIESGPLISGPAAYCRTASTGLRYSVAGAQTSGYQWSITDGTIVSGQGTNAITIDIPQGATAVLQVANAVQTSCVTTLRVGVDDRCLAFYNIITPNGDGKNDVFAIENVERYPNTSLIVYNRWGREVYQSSNYRNTYSGDGASVGIHYYRCQLEDGTTYKGWFEVVR